MSQRTRLSLIGIGVALTLAVDCLHADENHAVAIISQYCVLCHGDDAQEGNLNLSELLAHTPLVKDRETWDRVMQLVEMKAMPPADAEQPTAAERQLLLADLESRVVDFDYSTIDDPGFEPLRRLTHREFNNTVRDLFGVDLQPADRFPEELTGASGFDNSANTLFLQSSLMERYIGAAEGVVADALPDTPTSATHRSTQALVFVARPDNQLSEPAAADQVLRRFLLRAYRRPPTNRELRAASALFHEARASGKSFERAIKTVLPAVLISPKFLLRIEQGQPTSDSYRVDDWELASRLSYFLWASMPDDELFELATQNRLHEPLVLSAQVERMLADPKADALGHGFAAQWLNTNLVGTRIRLDPIDNAWCTDSLMSAMREETALFFMSLVRDDRSIDRLIDADYTFVNDELAATLYEMDGIEGSEMRRVWLEDANRGGILSQPAVLAVTSSYKETSPIKRGIYVLDTILGTPPPPPPPDVGELNRDLRRNRRLSFREKLEQHSSDATCRACHAKIDPMGFALENFDYFGRWREKYRRGKPIDAAAELVDGTRFDGPIGLKRMLLDVRHEQFVRQVAAKMLAYGLGRQLEYYDETAVRKIVTEMEADGFRLQTLIRAVIGSYPFQYRKNRPMDSST